jgi:hypothetical protein
MKHQFGARSVRNAIGSERDQFRTQTVRNAISSERKQLGTASYRGLEHQFGAASTEATVA